MDELSPSIVDEPGGEVSDDGLGSTSCGFGDLLLQRLGPPASVGAGSTGPVVDKVGGDEPPIERVCAHRATSIHCTKITHPVMVPSGLLSVYWARIYRRREGFGLI